MKFFFQITASLMLITCVSGVEMAFAQTNQVPENAPAAERPAVWGKPTETPNDSLVSPEVAPDGRVTFRLYAPEAKNVSLRVNSDFHGGDPQVFQSHQWRVVGHVGACSRRGLSLQLHCRWIHRA